MTDPLRNPAGHLPRWRILSEDATPDYYPTSEFECAWFCLPPSVMSTLGKCIYNKYTVFLENCNNRLYSFLTWQGNDIDNNRRKTIDPRLDEILKLHGVKLDVHVRALELQDLIK